MRDAFVLLGMLIIVFQQDRVPTVADAPKTNSMIETGTTGFGSTADQLHLPSSLFQKSIQKKCNSTLGASDCRKGSRSVWFVQTWTASCPFRP
jgi:hypothetical protein